MDRSDEFIKFAEKITLTKNLLELKLLLLDGIILWNNPVIKFVDLNMEECIIDFSEIAYTLNNISLYNINDLPTHLGIRQQTLYLLTKSALNKLNKNGSQ